MRASDNTTFEKHYRVSDLAELWSLGRETVRKLVKDDPGVIKIRMGRKKAHTVYSIPESAARRIHTRLLKRRLTAPARKCNEFRFRFVVECILKDFRQPCLSFGDPPRVMFTNSFFVIAQKVCNVRNLDTALEQYSRKSMP